MIVHVCVCVTNKSVFNVRKTAEYTHTLHRQQNAFSIKIIFLLLLKKISLRI